MSDTALAERPVTKTTTPQFSSKPLGFRLGEEVIGLDLKRCDDISDDTIKALWNTLCHRGILLFRKQHLNHDQHLAFTRRFGPLAKTGLTSRYAPEGYPDIFTVTNIRKNGERSETENAAQQWHTDQTFLEVPARASMLRCEIPPQNGGDTMFCSTYHIYDDLSEGLKKTLAPLRAFHTLFSLRSKVMAGRKPLSDEEMSRVYGEQGAMQPVVLTHPETGRKVLYINEQCVDHFDGWTVEESAPLLDYLYAQIRHPMYQYRHRWSAGDVVFWDNRCTQHYAPLDYDFANRDAPQNHRLMFRSTLA